MSDEKEASKDNIFIRRPTHSLWWNVGGRGVGVVIFT